MKTAQRELEVLQKDLENARLLAQSITNSDEASQEIGGLIKEALEDLATMDCRSLCRTYSNSGTLIPLVPISGLAEDVERLY
jgi:hypothetical protein